MRFSYASDLKQNYSAGNVSLMTVKSPLTNTDQPVFQGICTQGLSGLVDITTKSMHEYTPVFLLQLLK